MSDTNRVNPCISELKHENIIGLVDVFGHKSNISLGEFIE